MIIWNCFAEKRKWQIFNVNSVERDKALRFALREIKNKDREINENKCDFKLHDNLQVETFYERNFDGKEVI